ncbi:MAG: hypothetical protein EOO46_16020 [Flavobacterium sp.]|nr:MAG: hypothetical protein EOO46_16020 [Flavobacterium sp.]
MTKLKIQGKYSGSTYPFICFETDELLNASPTVLPDQSHLFMLAEIKATSPIISESQVENVIVIGTTINGQALKDKVASLKSITHILIVDNNPWIEKYGVNEELILQFKPEQICFLSKNTTLQYTPDQKHRL